MSDLLIPAIVSLVVLVLGLIIEYWVIQPLRARKKTETQSRNQRELKTSNATQAKATELAKWAEHSMRAFGQAKDLQERQQIIDENPILLTDQMDTVYDHLINEAVKKNDIEASRLFAEHRDFLRRRRKR